MMQTARLALGQSVGFKGQAAGTGAGTAVAAASAQEHRHIALAAHAHAEGTMDEALGLNAAVPGDVLHLRQAQLPGQHHPGEAQLFQFQSALQGVHAHLGGAMAGQLGGDLPDQGRYRQVLTDDRVCPAGGHCPDSLFQGRKLGAIYGGVQRYVHRHTPGMAETHGLLQAVRVKVAGTGAGIEARKAQIDCVRPAEHGRTQHFFTAHRGKDLNFRHNSPFVSRRFHTAHTLYYKCKGSPFRALVRRLRCLCLFGALLPSGLPAAFFGQLFPQGGSFPAQNFVFGLGLVLGQLGAGGIRNVILDLTAHILGAAGALAVFVQIIHGAEHCRLGHRKIFVLVQQLRDVLIQFFCQCLNVFFRIGRCDGIRRPRNVHSYLIDHVHFPFSTFSAGRQTAHFGHFRDSGTVSGTFFLS